MISVRTLSPGSLALAALFLTPSLYGQAHEIDLPSSKTLGVVPGAPQKINSLPMSMAVSPDKRYVVTVNAGYGAYESKYEQSIAVLDTQTGKIEDFPDARTPEKAKQTLYSGLAFSLDGKHLYASMGSTSNPVGDGKDNTGSGVVVYGFDAGKVTPERFLPIPLQKLTGNRRTKLIGGVDGAMGVPFPAAIAVLPGDGNLSTLLVADNLSDDVLMIEAATGAITHRFDLSESDAVPGTFPIALAVSKDRKRAFVALWNASEVVELDLEKKRVGRKVDLLKPLNPVKPGSHACDLALSPDGNTLYVALSNRDAVGVIDLAKGAFATRGFFDLRLPGQTYFGAEPSAVAVSADGKRVYAANLGSDAVAVLDATKMTRKAASHGMVEPMGFIPTEWMPMSLATVSSGTGETLYLATDKGRGTGPNNFPQRQVPGMKPVRPGPGTYIATLLHGSLATIDLKAAEAKLPAYTAEVVASNKLKAAAETIPFHAGTNPIKHVIYIIKENRTYDQEFGDLPVGNGDKSLTMYGEDITPNQHAMAMRFGVYDNFFDSGEVSGDGHVWSNAAIGTDYLEKTWQQSYRGSSRTYDYEGVVADGYPLEQKIADVNEPQSGYLWGNLAAHGKTLYHFGEYISSIFCSDKNWSRAVDPQAGAMPGAMRACSPSQVEPGGAMPEAWGGGVNKWPWAIPLMASNKATKPELVGHFAVEQPDFNLRIPDQIRAEVFERHLKQWVADRKAGNDTMPNFVMLRLANDHTAGTTAGGPTPKSSVADNDLAIGRAVAAVSHSPYWDDTAFFILEDDAQAGADHVDAHRSVALIVSKYAQKAPMVDSRFYSTVSMIRTMETVLGLPPMNNNDAFASLMSTAFTGAGDQPPFEVDWRNRDNHLIYTANPAKAATAVAEAGQKASAKMDFRHADRADTQKLNLILWQDAMGDKAAPAMLKEKRKKPRKDDDD
ncbi:Lactonase, 7-bladed beta-propeller [Granulicella pectinivorans]|uniref:Lactonase, 7-bladed beta-propeller n=1 Tax=Granulicella pectinivorans TaxID=474950 RepID=A0A1I6ME94_9BACT|nr:bifunctional YncE family protein/alkaline phosphatase family protein [Granulicella pectinivorans]SFS14039.1 Lactonase, 7-bladed beta-propeller [Granulicella pectinivorans]